MKRIILPLLLLLSPLQSHAGCLSNSEVGALDMRALQSSLMVAALSCDQQDDYNRFMRLYQQDLTSGGDIITTYFKRQYGSGYKAALNNFITTMANKATTLSMNTHPDSYCRHTKQTFATLLSLKKEGVARFAAGSEYSSLHGLKSCSG
jgi:uncharacterized protein YccT (UPF0319 family)